jgi:hypothetical protein
LSDYCDCKSNQIDLNPLIEEINTQEYEDSCVLVKIDSNQPTEFLFTTDIK